jgi:hypothetical protein
MTIEPKPNSRAERLAAALLADSNNVPRGDLNGRFCSMRCQDWFDAGNNPISYSDIDVPLGDWRVIAGPPSEPAFHRISTIGVPAGG